MLATPRWLQGLPGKSEKGQRQGRALSQLGQKLPATGMLARGSPAGALPLGLRRATMRRQVRLLACLPVLTAGAFVNGVTAFERSGRLTPEGAEELREAARGAIAAIGGTL